MAPFLYGPTPAQGTFVAEAVLVHDIPGRLRFVAPVLKHEPQRAAMLHSRLGQVEAVQAIHFNVLTGSVIIEYENRTGSREAVLRALHDAGWRLVQRTSPPFHPTASTELPAARAALTAVFHSVLNLALEKAIVAVI
jgi:Heavy metal associated domain 2